jgi:hypothetical protein
MAKHISQDEFDTYLENLVGMMTPAQLLAIPGVYEVLSEELNNDVMAAWEDDHPDDEDQEELGDDEDA